MKRQQVLGTAGSIMLLACTAMALPPTGSQCAGYSYSRSLSVVRSEDKLSVVAVSMIGGFNPCSFRTAVQLTSPTGRTASGVDGYNYSYNASNAQATATLAVQTDGGTYSATSQYGVQDDTVYPMQYYTPSPSSAQTVVNDATPTITSITPSIWTAGTTTSVTITGAGFGTTGPNLTISGAGVMSYAITSFSDTQINFNVTLDASSPPGSITVTVTANGYGGYPFLPGQSGQSQQAAVSASVLPLSLSQTPSTRDLSTGDTNRTITTNVTPGSFTYSPAFAWGLSSNPNSTCTANLGFSPGSGAGQVNSTVTASVAGCSGIFNVVAAVGSKTSSNSTTVTVPPQILIQMLYGEAHGQAASGDNASQLAIGETTRNRFSQPQYFNGVSTWQAAITSGQFMGIRTDILNGPTPDLANAAAVFRHETAGSVGNAACFFSPTLAGWQAIQAALQSGTTVLPTVVYDPGCYLSDRQFVVKQSIGNNADGRGAPAFIFLQKRNPATDPAVIQIP